MSSNVENKVVEFQFNNSNFEKNVSKSMSTLDKLKQALKFDDAEKSFSGLDKAVKNFDMSSMGESTDILGQKFSALQTIAVGALLKIGEQAVQTGTQLVKSLTVDQIAAGFDKYSQKVQATATIMAATGLSMEEIEEHLQHLNTYTDRTSYGFSQMVDNVGKFTSAGVELGDAVAAMEGIGNWASLSGVTAASGKAAIAMYNLSQAMGQGYLLMQDWRSIENVNMATQEFKNALIDTGVALGELEMDADGFVYTMKGTQVTAENLRSTLQERWVTKDVMLETLMRYSDETDVLGQKAYKAAAEARTLEDAIGAINDAVSTSWMQTEEMIFGDYEEATKFWTGLQDYVLAIFDRSMSARNELMYGGLKQTPWDDLKDTFESLNVSGESFEDRLYRIAKSHHVAVDQMINLNGSLEEAFRNGALDTKYISEVFSDYSSEMKRAATSTELEVGAMSEYEKVVRSALTGELGRGVELQRTINEYGYDYNQVLADMNQLQQDRALGIDWITDAQFEAIGLTREEAREIARLGTVAYDSESEVGELLNTIYRKSGRELLIESLYNALDGLVKIMDIVREAWEQIFPPLTAEQLYHLIEGFNELSKNFIMSDESAGKLRRTFAGLFAILKIVGNFISSAFSVGLGFLRGALSGTNKGFLDITASIGDFFVKLEKWVQSSNVFVKVFEEIGKAIRWVVEQVIGLFQAFWALPEVQEALGWLGDKAREVGEYFSKWYETAGGLTGILRQLFGILSYGFMIAKNWVVGIFQSIDFEGIKTNIQDLFGNFSEIIKKLFSKETLNKIKEAGFSIEGLKSVFEWFVSSVQVELDKCSLALQGFWQKVKEWASGIADSFDGVIRWVSEKFAKLWSIIQENIAGIIPILVGAGIFGVLLGVTKIVKSILGFFKPFSNLINAMADLARAEAMKKKMEALGDLIKAVGETLLMIAISLKVIDMIKDVDKTLQVASVMIAGVLAILIALSFLNGVSMSIDVKGMAKAMLELGAGVALLALAVLMVDHVNPDNVIKDLFIVGALVAFIIGANIAFSKLGGENGTKLQKGALFALAMAGAIKILVGAMQTISKMTGDEILKGLGVLIVLFGMLAILTKISSKISAKASLTVLGVAGAFLILAFAMKAFEGVNFEAMGKFFIAFLPLLFALFLTLAATKLAGENGLSAGLALLGIGAALFLIAKAMQVMGSLSLEQIGKSLLAILPIMGMMVGAIISTALAGDNAMKAGVTLLAMAAAIVILAGAMWLIAKIPADRVAGATGAIVAMIAAMSGALIASHFADKSTLGVIIALTVAIGVMAAALILMANIADPNALLASAMALGAVMTALSLVIFILGKTGKVEWGAIAQLAILAAIAAGIGALFAVISMIPGDPARCIAIAMSTGILLLTLAGVMAILNMTGSISGMAIAQLGVLTIVAGMLGLFLAALASIDFDIDHLVALTLSIAALMSVLTIVLMGLGVVGLMGPAAFVGIGALAALIGSMAVIFELIGLLGQIPGNQGVIESGIEIIKMMATGLGEAIGGFVNGVLMGATENLALVGARIAAFVTILKAAFIGVDQSMLDAATTLASVVLAFTAAEFIDGIVRFFSGGDSNLGKFGEDIAELGKHLATFNSNTASITDPDRFKKVAEAAKVLAEMALTMPDDFLTSEEMTQFGDSLSILGSAIQHFGVYANSTNVDKVKDAADAGMKVAELANSLAKEGGLLQALAGTTIGMDEFGGQLEVFGQSLVKFSEQVSGLTDEDIKSMDIATQAAGKVNDLASNLQTQGGWVGAIFGEKDLRNFGNQVYLFGYFLKLYAEQVSGLTEDAVTKAGIAADIAGPLVEMTKALNTDEHWYDVFKKDQDLSTWGEQIKKFGTGLVGYSQVLMGLDTTAVNNAQPAINSVIKASQAISDDNGTKGIGVAANQLIDFGDAVQQFAAIIGEAISGGFVSNVHQYQQALSEFSLEDTMFASDQVSNQGILETVSSFFTDIYEAATGFVSDFIDVGKGIVEEIGKGIGTTNEPVKTSAKNAAISGAGGAREAYGSFYSAGQYAGQGFVRGIDSYLNPAYWAGYNLGKEAVSGAKDATDERSPSKIFAQIAEFAGMPFVEHLLKYTDPAYDAGYELGYGAKLGLDASIDKMQAIIDGGVDVNPVITPVLDLTEIQNGVSGLNDMFGNDTYTLLGTLEAPIRQARVIDSNVRAMNQQQPNYISDPTEQGSTTNNYNTFNIQSSDPRQAAQEVSRIMQRDVVRKESVWA